MKCPKHPDRECPRKRARCEECLSALREYQRERRRKLLAAGLCVGTVSRSACTNPPRPGKTMCQKCADVFNAYQLERLEARRKKQ